jgi:hypothetical protein
MKNLKSRIWAGASALALVAVAAFGAAAIATPASAAPDGPASYIQITRDAGAQSLSNNGSYVHVSTEAAWSIQNEQGGYTFDSAGITVPVSGLYELTWSVLLTSGANGICGFAVNGATPDGGILHGIGPVANLAAASGSGATVVPLQEDDDVKLWCYGSGGSMTLQDSIANRIGVALIDELS